MGKFKEVRGRGYKVYFSKVNFDKFYVNGKYVVLD